MGTKRCQSKMAIERDLCQSGRTTSVFGGIVAERVVDREAASHLDPDPNRSPPALERLDPFPGGADSLLQWTSAGVGTAIRSRHLERIAK
jgi:hypothetical protein